MHFLRKIIVFGLVFIPLASLADADAETDSGEPTEVSNTVLPTLYLRVGERYPLDGVQAEKATIQPESVASLHERPQGLMLVGKRTGEAKLVLDMVGETEKKQLVAKVIVRPALQNTASTAPAFGNIQAELLKLPGLKFSQLGPKLLIQGEVLSRPAYQKVLLCLKTYPKNMVILALTAPGIKESLLLQAQNLLKAQGLNGVEISHAGHRYFLEGQVSTPKEVDLAFELGQSVFPNVENHLAVPIRVEPTISVRVFILELSRHAHRVLGLSWPSSIQQAFTLAPQTALFSPLWTVNLNHLSNEGQAKVLAEPMLAVKSGSEAELSAGGEIPIRVTGRYENKVQWKHYGLKIKIRIGGIAGKNIRTKIETESSQLDDATAVDGVPGIRNSTLHTEVDAIEGQPILLTGLFQAASAKDIDKIPVLGDLPIIGELFKSRRFRDHESELLVALLPTFGAQNTTLPLHSARGLKFDSQWRLLD